MIKYATNDATSVIEIRLQFINDLNKILKSINVSETYYFTNENTPKSFGSSVAEILLKYILNTFSEWKDDFDLINNSINLDKSFGKKI